MATHEIAEVPLSAWRTAQMLILILCSLLLSGYRVKSSLNLSDDYILAKFGVRTAELQDSMKATGAQLRDCFRLEEVQRQGKWRATDAPHVSTYTATMYGPGVNASSVDLLVQTFYQIQRCTWKTIGWMLGPPTSITMSQFEDPPAGVQMCGASVNSSCCPFDATRYRTVHFELARHATWQSRCYKILSNKGRSLRLQLYGGMIHDFGFPEVHMTDFFANFRVHPHPLLKYMTAFEDPFLHKALRVTLQFEGPCAVPFTIEKQTVLRVSLPLVMESDMNINAVDVGEIQERPGDGLNVMASATITLIVAYYDDALDVDQCDPFELLKEATTPREGDAPALNKLLSAAGLEASRIVILNVSEVEPGLPLTTYSSWEWSMKQLEEMEARTRLRQKWAMMLASIFVGVFSVFCVLSLQGCFAPKPKEDSRLRDVIIKPRRSLARRVSAGIDSDLSSSSTGPKVAGVIDAADVEFLRNSNGQKRKLGTGSSGQVFKGLLKGSPVAIKVVECVSSTTTDCILKEIAVLSGCRHSDIVQFLGVAFGENQVWLIMEYMEGGDLKRALQEDDRYRWGKRGPYAAYEVASALAYLHSYSVIHLDVKSANVLLNKDGQAKLCDVVCHDPPPRKVASSTRSSTFRVIEAIWPLFLYGTNSLVDFTRNPCVSSGAVRNTALHGSRGAASRTCNLCS
eukprot:jgi/Botrbrau1/6761/Bobra.0324s0043.3